jgi:F0F1-type ATP synthase membrane subunit b/b'
MSDVSLTQLLPLIGLFVLWYVLMRFVLPRLGVST